MFVSLIFLGKAQQAFDCAKRLSEQRHQSHPRALPALVKFFKFWIQTEDKLASVGKDQVEAVNAFVAADSMASLKTWTDA